MGAEIGLFLEPHLWVSKLISKLETGNWYLRHWIHEKNKIRASMTIVVTSIHNFKQESLFRIKAFRGVAFCEAGSSLAPLHLSRTLYKSPLFMQNKPNLLDAQMNLSIFSQMAYENNSNWTLGQNKPNSNPIAERVKFMQSLYLQRIMKKNAAKGYEKTKPKQTQFPKSQKWTQMSL